MGRRRAAVVLFHGLCALVLLAAARPIAAQHVVDGRVVSTADGAPLADVTVRVVGEDFTVSTDSAGSFRFELAADRPGVALELEVIGYMPFNRTWILPLAEPIVIGLREEAVELEGIDVEVDRPSMTPAEMLEYRVRSIPGAIPRTASVADLRAFEHQEAEIWDFLPEMTVAIDAGCDGCIMAAGRFEPTFIVDDRSVSLDEFRSWPVEDICRVDVVTIKRMGGTTGFVMAYTCRLLRDVAMGKRTLAPFLGGNRPR